MTRTERQKLCIRKWIKNGGNGILMLCTGFGKTRTAITLIQSLVQRKPNFKVLIIVPTEILQNQWILQLAEWKLINNCEVRIINSAIKKEYDVDLLIIDELHLSCSIEYINIFNHINYKYFLGLTGTIYRLDERENLLSSYTKIIDVIDIKEGIENNWISPYREYKVLLDVDLTEYNQYNKDFNTAFAFFNYDFKLAMECATNIISRRHYAKVLNQPCSYITVKAMSFMTYMRKRKYFVMTHEKKLEIAKKIINARQDKKIITFSGTIIDAEKIGVGYSLHSKITKKKNKITLEEFNKLTTGVLNTNKSADCGADVEGLNVAIIISGTSSKIQKQQRLGRTIRYQEGKVAEIFTLVIKNTVEESWYNNATQTNYMTISEQDLDLILNMEEINNEKINISKFKF